MPETGDDRGRESLTRGIGVTTTVDIQPGRPIDREFLPLVSDVKTKQGAGRFKSSFDALLKLHQAREHVYGRRRLLTYSQKSPANKKIESVRARLDRLGKEGDAARNADEFRRRKGLFEWVFFVRHKRLLTLTRPQGSRGDQGHVGTPVHTFHYC